MWTIKTFKKRVFPLSGSCLRNVLTVVGSHRRSLTSLSTMIGLLLFIRNNKRRRFTNFQRLANTHSYDVTMFVPLKNVCARMHGLFGAFWPENPKTSVGTPRNPSKLLSIHLYIKLEIIRNVIWLYECYIWNWSPFCPLSGQVVHSRENEVQLGWHAHVWEMTFFGRGGSYPTRGLNQRVLR